MGMTTAEILEIANGSRYHYFGIRCCGGGGRYDVTPVAIGDVLEPSYWWDDNESTGVLLDGTCAIGFEPERPETLEQALELIQSYGVGTIVLVGSRNAGQDAPSDPGEVILRDPVVLAILNG